MESVAEGERGSVNWPKLGLMMLHDNNGLAWIQAILGWFNSIPITSLEQGLSLATISGQPIQRHSHCTFGKAKGRVLHKKLMLASVW